MTVDMIKNPHLGSILISRVVDVDDISVINQLLNSIDILHDEIYFIFTGTHLIQNVSQCHHVHAQRYIPEGSINQHMGAQKNE